MNPNHTVLTRKKPKKWYTRKWVIAVFASVILLGSLGFIFQKQLAVLLFKATIAPNVVEAIDRAYVPIGTEVEKEEAVDHKKPFSLLLLGIDARKNDSGRSDTIIFSVVRPDDNKVLMVSIPRDTYAEIVSLEDPTKNNSDKINHAYAYGGVKMSIDSIELLMDNRIDYYGTINFHGLIDVVDAIGGVKLPITKVIENKDPDHEKLRIEPNKPIYNGEDALSYVRYREDSDENRTMRQRIFLSSYMDHLLQLKNITKVPELIKIAGNNFTTNMTSDFILDTAESIYLKDGMPSISSYMLHGEGAIRKGVWYYDADEEDLAYTKQLIANWLDPNTTLATLMEPKSITAE
ncbi:LCP family protein [Paenibacillus marinisediminis]